MIIRAGRHITVRVDNFEFQRTCETPGRTTVTSPDGDAMYLPGNAEDGELFIAAYRRVLAEEIDYVGLDSES